jgi:hypothetical protein
MLHLLTMKKTKKVQPMEKAIYVKAPAGFVEMLHQSQWYLKMRPTHIVREAIIEYLERHLPKEVKEEIMKKGGK